MRTKVYERLEELVTIIVIIIFMVLIVDWIWWKFAFNIWDKVETETWIEWMVIYDTKFFSDDWMILTEENRIFYIDADELELIK